MFKKLTKRSKEFKLGYEYVRGGVIYLLDMSLIIVIVVVIINITRNTFSIGVESTDKDGWNRSGLIIYTDHKTGVQYLSTKEGHLIPRVDLNGNYIIKKDD